MDPPPAARPQKELDQPLEKWPVGRRVRVGRRQYMRLEAKDRAIGLLERNPERHAGGRRGDEILKRPDRQHRGPKGRIEDRRDPGRDERQTVVRVGGRVRAHASEILAFHNGRRLVPPPC
jgi:hypothetical protein